MMIGPLLSLQAELIFKTLLNYLTGHNMGIILCKEAEVKGPTENVSLARGKIALNFCMSRMRIFQKRCIEQKRNDQANLFQY